MERWGQGSQGPGRALEAKPQEFGGFQELVRATFSPSSLPDTRSPWHPLGNMRKAHCRGQRGPSLPPGCTRMLFLLPDMPFPTLSIQSELQPQVQGPSPRSHS